MLRRVFARLIGAVQVLLSNFYLSKAKYSKDSHVENIYILCAQGAGDYLMATSAIKAIGEKFQQEQISILFARDEVYLLARLNKVHKSQNLMMIDEVVQGGHKVDLLISLSGPSRDVLSLINRVKPKKAIGFIFSFKIFSTFSQSTPKNYLFENHIKRNDEVARKLTATPDGTIHFDFLDAKFLKREPPTNIGLYFPYVKKRKTLPRRVLVEFAQSLVAGDRYETVCLFDYEGEAEDLKDLSSCIVGQRDRIGNFSCVSYENWEELLKILLGLDKVVCTDSVVFHLCNALEIPVVGIFGATNPMNYVPYDFKGQVVTHNLGPNYCYYGTGYNKCMKRGCVDRCHYMSRLTKHDLEESI
jgi:ADP-heptose:LPS heptosyltransferase